MACYAFDPKLPHGTPDEEKVWFAAFIEKVRVACAHECDEKCKVEDDSECGNCIKQACSSVISTQCTQCLDKANSIDDLINCVEKTTSHTLSPELLAGIIIGAIFLTVFIIFSCYFGFKFYKRTHSEKKKVV